MMDVGEVPLSPPPFLELSVGSLIEAFTDMLTGSSSGGTSVFSASNDGGLIDGSSGTVMTHYCSQ